MKINRAAGPSQRRNRMAPKGKRLADTYRSDTAAALKAACAHCGSDPGKLCRTPDGWWMAKSWRGADTVHVVRLKAVGLTPLPKKAGESVTEYRARWIAQRRADRLETVRKSREAGQ